MYFLLLCLLHLFLTSSPVLLVYYIFYIVTLPSSYLTLKVYDRSGSMYLCIGNYSG